MEWIIYQHCLLMTDVLERHGHITPDQAAKQRAENECWWRFVIIMQAITMAIFFAGLCLLPFSLMAMYGVRPW